MWDFNCEIKQNHCIYNDNVYRADETDKVDKAERCTLPEFLRAGYSLALLGFIYLML